MIDRAELQVVIDRFPAFSEKLQKLYNENEEFQSLCNDYTLCVKSILQRVAKLEDDKQLIREYTDLKSTLEDELNQFIINDAK